MAPPSHRGRKRMPVSHYSDDNPSTFTTKHKRGSPATTRGPSPLVEEEPQEQVPLSPPPRRHKRPLSGLIVNQHDLREQPILPQLVPSPQHVFNHIPQPPLPKPQWTMVGSPYDHEIHPPRITCMATFDHYLVCGNVLGEVLLYSLEPVILHISTLQTSSTLRISGNAATRTKKRNDPTILALAMRGNQICVATLLEIECYDAIDQSIISKLDLTGGQVVSKLDMHPTKESVLVSFSDASPWLFFPTTSDNDSKVQHILPLHPKCTAVYDLVDPSRTVVVANTNEQQELLLVDEDFQIRKSTSIPTKGKLMESSISQFRNYTCIASSRGVRVYDTDTLSLIKVYGDGVALHGHTLVYQEGFMVQSGVGMEDTNMWVVGVPHAFKEPRDLQETLHLWAWWDTIHPSLTLHGPPRSRGLARVLSLRKRGGLLALTQAGDVWQLLPSKKSDWPGVMYPPGYKVILDNLEYIEDEDEMDIVCGEWQEEVLETEQDELQEAIKLSVMEENVVTVHDGSEEEHIVIPCHPDPRLKEALQQDSNGVGSPERPCHKPSFLQVVLDAIPHRKVAQDSFRRNKERPTMEQEAIPVKPVRGKRSRASNLETMIKASLDPELRKLMINREQWADGKGSSLREMDMVPLQVRVTQMESTSHFQGKKLESSATLNENRTAGSTEQTMRHESEAGATIVSNEKAANAGTISELMVADRHDAKPPAVVGRYGNASMERFAAPRSVMDATNPGADVPLFAEAESSSSDVSRAAGQTSLELFNEAVASRPIDDAATSALEGMLALQRSFSEDNSPMKSPGPKLPSVPPFADSITTVSLAQTFETASPTANMQCTDALNGPENCAEATKLTESNDYNAFNGADDGQSRSQAVASTAEAVNVDDAASQEPAAPVGNCSEGGDAPEGTAPEVVTDRDSYNSEARGAPVGIAGTDMTDDSMDVHTEMTDNAMDASCHPAGFVDTEKTDNVVDTSSHPVKAVDTEMTEHGMDASSRRVAAIDGCKTELPVVSSSEEGTATPFDEAASHSTSHDTKTADTPKDAQKVDAEELTPLVFCSACRGRMVIHACGKREIPVDFEAMARAEKEQREKEEEEKKALRVQKRREADARRRETRRKKKEEEEKKRREEEKQRRMETVEMERARVQAEYEERLRVQERAERWARLDLMATGGGRREGETFVPEMYSDLQVDSGPPQHAYNAPPTSYGVAVEQNHAPQPYHHQQHVQDMHQNGGYNMSQQHDYSQSYEQQYRVETVGAQPSLYTQQDRAPHYHQQLDMQQNVSTVLTQATYDCPSVAQPPVDQPTSYPLSYDQHTCAQPQSTYTAVSAALQAQTHSAQHQYSGTYEQQHVPISQSPVEARAAPTNPDVNTQPPFDSTPSYEQPQTEFACNSRSGDQEASEPASRRTSAQLGTAEVLASLASMCEQMQPVETNDSATNEMIASDNSFFQPSSLTIGESVDVYEVPASAHVKAESQSEVLNRDNSFLGDAYSQPLKAIIRQTLSHDEAPASDHVESALESEPVETYLGYPVAGQSMNPFEASAPGHVESVPQSGPVASIPENEAREKPLADEINGRNISSEIGPGVTDLSGAAPIAMPPHLNAEAMNDAGKPKENDAAPVADDLRNGQIDTIPSQNITVSATSDGYNQDHH